MAESAAQRRANLKYKKKAYDRIEVRVQKGKGEAIKARASELGLGLNAYINSLIDADMGLRET